MSASKTAYYYQPKKRAQEETIKRYLLTLAQTHKRWGFDKMMLKAKMDGKPWNHKRVYRIYCEQGLNIRVKPRKRIPKGEAKTLFQPICKNLCWSMDFMTDVLECGQKFRTLNVIDDYNRQCLLIEPAYSLPSTRVTQLLDEIALTRGYPEMIRVDNGPEFISKVFKQWAEKHGILICYIQPGKPAQNGFIERFNRIFREDILDMNVFRDLRDVRNLAKTWIETYNNERPHESLAGLSPVKFEQQRKKTTLTALGNSTFN
jgi:putative transposase